jgi:hypothetical protein
LLNFSFCFAARQYLRPGKDLFGSPKALERAFDSLAAKTNDRINFNPSLASTV